MEVVSGSLIYTIYSSLEGGLYVLLYYCNI